MANLLQSRTVVIVETVLISILSPFCFMNIFYAPLLFWRMFFGDSNLGYDLEAADTPAMVYKIFSWLLGVSNTAYETFAFLNFPVVGFVKWYVLKFVIYAGYAMLPLLLLTIFAMWHRSALTAARSQSLQPYYIQIGHSVPIMFAQFDYPFRDIEINFVFFSLQVGGVKGVIGIVALCILFIKYFPR
jgi:hypothetical protein